MGEKKHTDIDALTIAIQIEKMGRKFYLALANKTRKKDLKPVFKALAANELEHLRTFEQMRVELNEDKYWFGEYSDPDFIDYLRALNTARLFSGGAKDVGNVVKKCGSAVDGLLFGISVEKDTILFYSHLWEHSVDKHAKEIFSILIDEEKKHLQVLVGKLVELA